MNVTFFYQHFWPDSPPYANLLRTIGNDLVSGGDVVRVVTQQPSYKENDRRHKTAAFEVLDGIEVYRLPCLPLSRRFSSIRLLGKLLFPLRATFFILFARLTRRFRSDVIVAATIPPVLNGLFGLIAARFSSCAFIYHFQDIYPEIGAVAGLWSAKSGYYRVLRWLDTRVANNADRCVVLSEDMREALLDRGVEVPVDIINNMMLGRFHSEVSGGVTTIASSSDSIEQRNPVNPNRLLTVVFAGNLGRFQGLVQLAEAFSEVDFDRHNIELLFVGEGAVRDEIAAISERCSRVLLRDHIPYEDAVALMRQCDAGIVSITPGIYQYAYPSKTLTYLGLGLPMLVVVERHSQLAAEVLEHDLGIVVEPGDQSALTSAFTQLDSCLRKADYSQSVIRYHDEHYSRAEILRRWQCTLQKVCSDREVACEQ